MHRAIRRGELVRPSACEKCQEPARPEIGQRGRITAHHEDYTKPLEVIWLCHECHKSADVARRDAEWLRKYFEVA